MDFIKMPGRGDPSPSPWISRLLMAGILGQDEGRALSTLMCHALCQFQSQSESRSPGLSVPWDPPWLVADGSWVGILGDYYEPLMGTLVCFHSIHLPLSKQWPDYLCGQVHYYTILMIKTTELVSQSTIQSRPLPNT